MPTFNKMLVVAGFALALLLALYSAEATKLCETRTKEECRINKHCAFKCKHKLGYTGGHCSKMEKHTDTSHHHHHHHHRHHNHHHRCICTKPCNGSSMGMFN
ncbi:hypothetical protein EJB05_27257 [Eragrostis curvula]|uniref:Knottin scorpion toxin-like domain-containing protein n=1 Tax=Eragrostis curvula TaxID=38414 RepID=A0A5J9UN78_9POAL|nr:hypothetical protein EJB05_27257 [Eragrostis curvula]